MSAKVSVKPRLLQWARQRAELEPEELAKKVGLRPRRIHEWEETGELTLDHLERVADKTHTPIGFLFLDEPPTLELPIADFRSRAGGEPSPDLLETVYQCELRQAWYRDRVTTPADELKFVGSVGPSAPVASVAEDIRATIGVDLDERAAAATWADALRDLCERVENAGIMVMRNGVVGNNTHRPLSVREFRGFALSDRFAPLIFINASDSKAAQLFTVIHELVHIWRGESGVSDASRRTSRPAERFCNQVAAEVLVPMSDFRRNWSRVGDPLTEVRRLAQLFKVSSLVILIRAREADFVSDSRFTELYEAEVSAAQNAPSKPSGGDFYRTQRSRLGTRFAAAVIASAVEGGTSYTEAFQLLGVRKLGTFQELGRAIGVLF